MALDNTSEFFEGDFVYVIMMDGRVYEGEIVGTSYDENGNKSRYLVACDSIQQTIDTTADFLSYTL